MDFELHYTKEQEEFAREVRAWIDANIPNLDPPEDLQNMTHEMFKQAREFRRKLGEKGWLAPTYPKEYGGGGLSIAHAVVIAQELAQEHLIFRILADRGVDLFAPAIGTAHGVYTTKDPKVDFERMGKIAQLVNGKGVRAPLIVHGGTGLPPHTVAKLIELGGAKFNVSTELKYTLIDTTFNYINEHRKEYNPGKINTVVKNAIREAVEKWIDMLGSAGKA